MNFCNLDTNSQESVTSLRCQSTVLAAVGGCYENGLHEKMDAQPAFVSEQVCCANKCRELRLARDFGRVGRSAAGSPRVRAVMAAISGNQLHL